MPLFLKLIGEVGSEEEEEKQELIEEGMMVTDCGEGDDEEDETEGSP